jgi:hypothetical protein
MQIGDIDDRLIYYGQRHEEFRDTVQHLLSAACVVTRVLVGPALLEREARVQTVTLSRDIPTVLWCVEYPTESRRASSCCAAPSQFVPS